MGFRLRIRVRYAECDAQNVVFNARYGDYVDLAATEFMRTLIGGYDELLEKGFDNQVVRLLTEWQAPARFDDVLDLAVTVARIGNTSFTLNVAMSQAQTQQVVAQSEVVYVVSDRESGDKCVVPDFLRNKLEQGIEDTLVDQSGSQI